VEKRGRCVGGGGVEGVGGRGWDVKREGGGGGGVMEGAGGPLQGGGDVGGAGEGGRGYGERWDEGDEVE